MIMLFISLFVKITIEINFTEVDYTSIYKNNKLYVYEPDDIEIGWSGLSIYNLRSGPISDIQPQSVNFTNSNPIYTPQFLHLPQGLPDGRSNEIWMIGGFAKDELKDINLTKENWSCEILDNNELKFHDNFIPMPLFENFPKSGFSQTIVNSDKGPELYIIGGLLYFEELNTSLITNYFFKYEFNTREWNDLSGTTKSILEPRAFHRVIEANSSLLLFGGIRNNKSKYENYKNSVPIKNASDFDDFATVFKFDLKEQKWSTVNTKLNKDPNIYRNGATIGSSFNVYKERIISYSNLYNSEGKYYEPQIGILDYNTWDWEWHDVKNESGIDNNLLLSYYQTLVINDQLILIHGMSNQRHEKKLYVINLKTYTFQGFLNIKDEYSKSKILGPSGWTVDIVVICSILLILLLIVAIWFYLRYKNRVKESDTNSEQVMHELWASTYRANERLNPRSSYYSNSNTENTDELNNTALIECSIVHYECFQYEADLEFFEISKTENFN